MSQSWWMNNAECKGIETNLFMPDEDGVITKVQMQEALKYCDSCVVRDDCRDYAIKMNITVGIYGGLSNKGRREYVSGKNKTRSTKEVRPKEFWEIKHGTLNAYQRHKCRCIPCAEVGREHWRRAQALRKARKDVA